jgi:hypothetical protein
MRQGRGAENVLICRREVYQAKRIGVRSSVAVVIAVTVAAAELVTRTARP